MKNKPHVEFVPGFAPFNDVEFTLEYKNWKGGWPPKNEAEYLHECVACGAVYLSFEADWDCSEDDDELWKIRCHPWAGDR